MEGLVPQLALTDCVCVRDSVRIDGTGAASIMEVSFQDIPVTEEQDNQSELKVIYICLYNLRGIYRSL